MAKRRQSVQANRPPDSDQPLPTYDELTGALISETTSILTDFYRQYIAAYGGVRPNDSIFINWDPVLRTQTYQQWAQYDLYWYLEQDTQINSILSSAKVNVAGMNWKVKPFLRRGEKKPSTTSQDQADFIKDMLEGMETWPQHLYDLMDALGKGFSFSEIIWELKDNFWQILRLMNRTQRRIQFDAQTRQPRIRTDKNPFYGDPIEPGKYIVHRCSANWENPFGDAKDQSLYWMWLFKHTALQYYLRHLETNASAVPIVVHPANATDTVKDQALDAASLIHNGAYGRLPDNFKLLWAEVQGAAQAGESFDKCIRLCDEQMTKCVKGSILTTEASGQSGMGSRSMGKTHKITEDQFDVFRAKGLAASVNKYLVKFAIDYNFASVESYPRFVFDVEEEEDLKDASEVLLNLTKALAGYEPDIEDINERFGYTFVKKEKSDLPILPIDEPIKPAPEFARRKLFMVRYP